MNSQIERQNRRVRRRAETNYS